MKCGCSHIESTFGKNEFHNPSPNYPQPVLQMGYRVYSWYLYPLLRCHVILTCLQQPMNLFGTLPAYISIVGITDCLARYLRNIL